MTKTRFIGDVHAHYGEYASICKDAEGSNYRTIQIGDLGFCYNFFKHHGLQSANHQFFGGNHDNYSIINDCKYNLGDFGSVSVYTPMNEFFFVRGAHSIDKSHRIEGKDWWPEEELSIGRCNEAIEFYKKCRPETMVTHDGPDFITNIFIDNGYSISGKKIPSRTGRMLQAMLELHRPKTWIFGHWHIAFDETIKGTRFICLPELGFIDL